MSRRLAPPFELFGAPDDMPVVMSGQIIESEEDSDSEGVDEDSLAALMRRLNQPRFSSVELRQPGRAAKRSDLLDSPYIDEATDEELRLQMEEAKRSIWTNGDRWLVVVLCGFAVFLSSFGTGCFQPTQVTLETAFHMDFFGVVLTLQSFSIVSGVAPLLLSGLVESMQRRVVYMVCLPLFAAAQIATGFVPTQHNYVGLLIFLRCLSGLAAAPFIALGTACVIDTFRASQTGLGLGLLLLPSAVGTVIGPIVGGYLVRFLDWRWTLWLPGLLAVAHLLPVLLWLPETKIVSRWSQRRNQRNYWSTTNTAALDSTVNIDEVPPVSESALIDDQINPLPLIWSLLREYPATLLVAASRGMTLSSSQMFFPFQQEILSTRWLFGPVLMGFSFLPSAVGAVIGSLVCGPITDLCSRRIGYSSGPLICALLSDVLFTVAGLAWILLIAIADPWVALSLQFVVGFCIRVSRVGYFSTVVAYCPKRAITLTTILQFISFFLVGFWSVVDPLIVKAADSYLLPLIVNMLCCDVVFVPCAGYALWLLARDQPPKTL